MLSTKGRKINMCTDKTNKNKWYKDNAFKMLYDFVAEGIIKKCYFLNNAPLHSLII